MKELVKYMLIAFCALSLLGCKSQDQEPASDQPGMDSPIDIIENSNEDISNNSESDNENSSSSDKTVVYEPVTGDNLTVAAEFAKDLIDENFPKLLQAYQFDAKMKTAITSVDTKKTVMFYNSEFGKFKAIKEAYTLSVGAYRYVMVPVECSINNFNFQIAFDGNHNIVGFTYGEYVTSKPSEDKIPEGVTEAEYTFVSDGYVIPGTFTSPKEGNHFPVVILVQGSGPSDRDESIYENKPFRDIAWTLAKAGIATYRYDKRNYLYAEQVGEDVTFTIEDEIIHDVVAATGMVKKLEYADPSRTYILGHGLGGYAMPRIAENLTGMKGYILMAAPAEHVKEYILGQYGFLADEDETITKEEQDQLNTVGNQLKLLDKPENIPANMLILGAYKDYWIDLANYNPIAAAKKIKEPVLVLQGERDYQVTIKQYNIWQANFKDSDNWVFKSYSSLNHFMMAGTGIPNSKEYRTRLHVDEQVLQDIIEFIQTELP